MNQQMNTILMKLRQYNTQRCLEAMFWRHGSSIDFLFQYLERRGFVRINTGNRSKILSAFSNISFWNGHHDYFIIQTVLLESFSYIDSSNKRVINYGAFELRRKLRLQSLGTLRYQDGKARTGTAEDAGNFCGSRRGAKNKMLESCIFV